eukprot:CAMPEP_0116011966 /NCGR_PEP_ID=MMETSP0321-20121206/4860_1 /TAXON_ID=163516 /ORGANISM="Leptocylindrus danicus var. danicus, Strain B650" /LENGTH=449 /DNA_ID=CAMNT_0003481255 /DNA_START=1279 /DNA_END=2628 /DNA_ORIENTATION=-
MSPSSTTEVTRRGSIICTEKLKRVRIRHLPRMGITDFDDQLAIMNRIRTLLGRVIGDGDNGDSLPLGRNQTTTGNQAIISQSSQQQQQQQCHSNRMERGSASSESLSVWTSTSASTRTSSRVSAATTRQWGNRRSRDDSESFRTNNNFDVKAALAQLKQMQKDADDMDVKSSQSRRRSSLSITNVQQQQRRLSVNASDVTQNEFLREAEKNSHHDKGSERRMIERRTRRKSSVPLAPGTGILFTQSLEEKEQKASLRELALHYGESAQRTACAELNLNKLGKRAMNSFKKTIACERCSILFCDRDKNELFFFDDKLVRFSLSLELGIAGYVAKHGEIANVSDVYVDSRFNKNLDEQTGFRTKSLLCAPIKNRSGDCIIAVIQMLNKKGGESFTDHDEDLMRNCSFKVAEALELQADVVARAQADMTRLVKEESKGRTRRKSSLISKDDD